MAMSRRCAALGIALAIALPAAAQAAEPIKIGMVVPLTGSIADAGRYGVQGAKLAIEEVNKAGGALGRPTWTMLPLGADYRWLTAGEASPWYPSMRLFRQPALADWPAGIIFAEKARPSISHSVSGFLPFAT